MFDGLIVTVRGAFESLNFTSKLARMIRLFAGRMRPLASNAAKTSEALRISISLSDPP